MILLCDFFLKIGKFRESQEVSVIINVSNYEYLNLILAVIFTIFFGYLKVIRILS